VSQPDSAGLGLDRADCGALGKPGARGIIPWGLFAGGPLCPIYGSLLCVMFLPLAERAAVTLLQRWWRESGYSAFGLTVGSRFAGGAPDYLVRALGRVAVVLIVALLIGELRQLLPQKQLTAYAARTA
jgi:uncharacterized membrane protein AbrB (regulator of aidB expression)